MNDTRPDTTRGGEIDALMGELRRLADNAAGKCQQVSDAALGLIAALSYKDPTLVESSFVTLVEGLAEVANDCVVRELRSSDGTRDELRAGWQKYIDKKAFEIAVFESIKDAIESVIDERISSMLKVRKFVQGVEQLGQPVEKSQALEEGIRELRNFREDFLRGWPSRRPPAPIDREAVSKAREAIRRGEKGLSKGQLIWGDKRPEKAV